LRPIRERLAGREYVADRGLTAPKEKTDKKQPSGNYHNPPEHCPAGDKRRRCNESGTSERTGDPTQRKRGTGGGKSQRPVIPAHGDRHGKNRGVEVSMKWEKR